MFLTHYDNPVNSLIRNKILNGIWFDNIVKFVDKVQHLFLECLRTDGVVGFWLCYQVESTKIHKIFEIIIDNKVSSEFLHFLKIVLRVMYKWSHKCLTLILLCHTIQKETLKKMEFYLEILRYFLFLTENPHGVNIKSKMKIMYIKIG